MDSGVAEMWKKVGKLEKPILIYGRKAGLDKFCIECNAYLHDVFVSCPCQCYEKVGFLEKELLFGGEQ